VPDESSIEMIAGYRRAYCRQMVQERMQQVILRCQRADATRNHSAHLGDGPFMKIGITSDTMSQIDMSMIAY
jgi:hypothetical protein